MYLINSSGIDTLDAFATNEEYRGKPFVIAYDYTDDEIGCGISNQEQHADLDISAADVNGLWNNVYCQRAVRDKR